MRRRVRKTAEIRGNHSKIARIYIQSVGSFRRTIKRKGWKDRYLGVRVTQSLATIMSRPELTGHASHFYNDKEARKYNSSSRMINVQREITLRAIELLLLPPDQTSFILDVGCGSGLSGQVLEEKGHVWVGCDVSRDMLQVAHERIEESFEKDGGDGMNDGSDDDSDEEDSPPSTGDLMHHVRLCSNVSFLSATRKLFSHTKSIISQMHRIWEAVYPSVLQRSMPAFQFPLFSGCVIVTRQIRFRNED